MLPNARVQVRYTSSVDTTQLGQFKPEDGLDMGDESGAGTAG